MNVNTALQSTFGDNVQGLRSPSVYVCDRKIGTIAIQIQVVWSSKCSIIVCFFVCACVRIKWPIFKKNDLLLLVVVVLITLTAWEWVKDFWTIHCIGWYQGLGCFYRSLYFNSRAQAHVLQNQHITQAA